MSCGGEYYSARICFEELLKIAAVKVTRRPPKVAKTLPAGIALIRSVLSYYLTLATFDLRSAEQTKIKRRSKELN